MKDFNVRFLQEDEYSTWNDLVAHSPIGTVFHRTEWCQAIYQLDPGVSLQIAGCFKGDQLVGGMITGSKRKWGVFNLTADPYSTPFYGMVIADRDTSQTSKAESFRNEVFSALITFLENHFHTGRFSFHPLLQDIRTFIWSRNKTEVLYTYRSRLQDTETMFSQLLPALRRQIKKGEKLSYEIEEFGSGEELSEMYDLLLSSYTRQGHSFKFSREQFITFCQLPFIRELLTCYVIRWEGKLVSSLVILRDGNTAYYWQAGGDHRYFNTGLNQVLFWQVIRRLFDSGCETFDFFGANTPSIAIYKSGYNFELVPYYRVTFESGWPIRFVLAVKKMLAKA